MAGALSSRFLPSSLLQVSFQATVRERTTLLYCRSFVPFCTQSRIDMAKCSAKSPELSDVVHFGSMYEISHLSLRNCHVSVPLDYNSADSARIKVFFREVVATEKKEQQLPYLLFLQGGPGFESPRPSEGTSWLKRACEEFRVILLDQRGTGLSTPLTTSSLSQFGSAKEQADYLQHFRADSIIKDAEHIRSLIVKEPWTVLGQSYGGFCAVTYLSFAPAGLKQVLLTGGIPPISSGCTADPVYQHCFRRVIKQNKKFYSRFPEAVKIVQDIVLHLHDIGEVELHSGGKLTPRSLQLLGLSGLGSSGGFERLYHLLETAWDPVLVHESKRTLSSYFLHMFEKWLPFSTNPLYALMHESIYCQGAASRWAAERVRGEYEDQFNAVKCAKDGQPVLFTGEMVFPWMFDEIAALVPLKEVANILALKDDWSPLYSKEALNSNKVPVAAAVYYEDMYVDFQLSEETAEEVAGIRLWITNEFMHSGIRDDGPRILDHLFDMLRGKKVLQ